MVVPTRAKILASNCYSALAAGASWRELLEDLELRLDLGSDDDSEDREYVRGLFEADVPKNMSYEGHD